MTVPLSENKHYTCQVRSAYNLLEDGIEFDIPQGSDNWGQPVTTLNQLLQLDVGDLLARTIYGECDIDTDNYHAVAWTIENRRIAGYGSYYDIITGPWQFVGLTEVPGSSTVMDSWHPLINENKWNDCVEIALLMINGRINEIVNPIGTRKDFKASYVFQPGYWRYKVEGTQKYVYEDFSYDENGDIIPDSGT